MLEIQGQKSTSASCMQIRMKLRSRILFKSGAARRIIHKQAVNSAASAGGVYVGGVGA